MLQRRPIWGAAILLSLLSFLLMQSTWQNWAGGWCWGPRHIVQLHALLAFPIAFFLAAQWGPVRRIAVVCMLIVGASIQIYGCSQSFIEFYRLYYQGNSEPRAHLLYDPSEQTLLPFRYALYSRDPQTGQPASEIAPWLLPAPINDSIYLVQNSQWPRYAEMWRRGFHDFFWLHCLDAGRP